MGQTGEARKDQWVRGRGTWRGCFIKEGRGKEEREGLSGFGVLGFFPRRGLNIGSSIKIQLLSAFISAHTPAKCIPETVWQLIWNNQSQCVFAHVCVCVCFTYDTDLALSLSWDIFNPLCLYPGLHTHCNNIPGLYYFYNISIEVLLMINLSQIQQSFTHKENSFG